MSTSSPEAVKKLLENMQADLRSLSMECKKKFPPVKEVHTHLYVWTRNIYTQHVHVCVYAYLIRLYLDVYTCICVYMHI